jgi:O-acetyl-ADP-ribose deacetylase (regulator of RNase III)
MSEHGIDYVTGDATCPRGDGQKIVAHVVNDQSKWGSGFVLAVSARWPETKELYHDWMSVPVNLSWCQGEGLPRLGNVQYVQVEEDVQVANLLAQRGVRHNPQAPRAVDYNALHACLQKLGRYAADTGASVHMPRIGCGLGGGEWPVVEDIILKALVIPYGVPVTVYDL